MILREKDLSPDAYTALAEKVLRTCGECGVTLVIHNFPETARTLGVQNLHIPLTLLSFELCREFETIGTSVHSIEQLQTAEQLGADYVTAGHIFATDCKKGLPPRGLDFLREVCSAVDIPVYAIGGISAENYGSVLAAGAAGACVMSGLMTCPDPQNYLDSFREESDTE